MTPPRENALRKINDQIYYLRDKITIDFPVAQSYTHGLIEMAAIAGIITEDEKFNFTSDVYDALNMYQRRAR